MISWLITFVCVFLALAFSVCVLATVLHVVFGDPPPRPASQLPTANAFKPGDRVTFQVNGVVCHGTVKGTGYGGFVYVVRDGVRADGRRHNRLRRNMVDMKPVADGKYDPVTGNVFADFLEERGQPVAAAMLREAFPIATGQKETTGA